MVDCNLEIRHAWPILNILSACASYISHFHASITTATHIICALHTICHKKLIEILDQSDITHDKVTCNILWIKPM